MMGKRILFAVLALFLVGFVSAHYEVGDDYVYKEKITETKYYPDDDEVWSRTTYVDYENDDRYPTYDYRHGYTYRDSVDYRNRQYKKKRDIWDDKDRYSKKRYHNKKDYYYDYYPQLRIYEKKECYREAPRGKLFYTRCP
jgi:hypothetical protein